MAERWRSQAAREPVAAIRKVGGTVERTGRGKLRVTGPAGAVVVNEPGSETRPDLARNSAARLVAERTGLDLTPRG